MDLLEYIKMSYLRPNRAVLQGLGASNDLIEYLLKTPNNMNINVVNGLIGSSSSGGVVLYEGIGQVDYESEADVGQVTVQVDSMPSTLNNIQVGTTFKVEVDGEAYDFTIARITPSTNGFEAASFSVADIDITEIEFPIFILQFETQGKYAQGMYGFAVKGPIDKETVNIKITQTSDYEELITGPYHLTIDFNGGSYGSEQLTTFTLDTDFYSNDEINLLGILGVLSETINKPQGKENYIAHHCTTELDSIISPDIIKLHNDTTVYVYWAPPTR